MSEYDFSDTRRFGERVQFGHTAGDYRRFRAGFPPEFFDALAKRGWIHPGQRALDLGTGTGTVARGLAAQGLVVVGRDRSAEMLESAKALDREAGVAVSYELGAAEDLGGADGVFEVVTAGQCWHWFDGMKATAEVSRVLRKGGRVIIAHFDWLPLRGNVVEATERVIEAFNPTWTMGGRTGIYPRWLTDLAEGGFQAIETFSFDVVQSYSHEAWRGRVRASSGVGASLDTAMVERFDSALAGVLRSGFSEEPLAVSHRVWAVSALKG